MPSDMNEEDCLDHHALGNYARHVFRMKTKVSPLLWQVIIGAVSQFRLDTRQIMQAQPSLQYVPFDVAVTFDHAKREIHIACDNFDHYRTYTLDENGAELHVASGSTLTGLIYRIDVARVSFCITDLRALYRRSALPFVTYRLTPWPMPAPGPGDGDGMDMDWEEDEDVNDMDVDWEGANA